MKKIIITITLFICAYSAAQCQRTLEIISPPMLDLFTEIAFDEYIYFIERGGATLQRFDGTTYSQFAFPVRDGVQLRYSTYLSNFFSFGPDIYIVLNRLLYKFDGSTFTLISFPGDLASDVVVYRHKIHVLIRNTDGVKMFSFDGSVATEVPSSVVPTHSDYHLMPGAYLYISRGHDIIRYDGGSFRTVPALPLRSGIVQRFLQLYGSEKTYFVTDSGAIYFFDGTSMTEIYNVEGVPACSPLLWRSELYFMTATESTPGIPFAPYLLFKSSGATPSEITIPSATFSSIERIAVYRDRLYLPVLRDGNASIHKFDGSEFTEVLPLPEGAHGTSIKIREGNLTILPSLANGDLAYEYDGVTFTEIRSPGEEWIFQSEQSATCYHAWLIGYVDENDHQYKFVAAVERANVTCPPAGGGGSGSTPIIPDRLRNYEHVVISNLARDRDWCWTGIDVDWVPQPCTLPPCEDHSFSTTITDKNGKIAWQKTFSKPFSTSVPIADVQPYTLSLGVEKDNVIRDVLVFDNDLVNKGFEGVKLDMYPEEEYFYLTVSTDKNLQVPFTMTLRNVQGQSLWQEKYIAPIDQLIRAYALKGGDYLQFSLLTSSRAGVTSYPNPFDGKLTIKVMENDQHVQVSIYDFNGKVIITKDFLSAGEFTLDVSDQKPGLYVLTIHEEKSTRRELVELKK